MQGQNRQISTFYIAQEQFFATYAKYLLIVLFPIIVVLMPNATALAQKTSTDVQEVFCYAVADAPTQVDDTENVGSPQNRLVFIDTATGNTSSNADDSTLMDIEYADTGQPVFDIEATSFAPVGGALYAANTDQLGLLNLANGNFRPLPNRFGTGNGFVNDVLTEISFDHVISLGFDLRTGVLYGVNRISTSSSTIDMLIAIDYTSGSAIPQLFTVNNKIVDFIVLEPIGESHVLENITVDPVTGVMYGIINNQVDDIDQLLIIDKASGVMVEIGYFLRSQTGEVIGNMEGLSFSNQDGDLYGLTGKSYKEKNLLWQIDKNTGAIQQIGAFQDGLSNFKSLACSSTHSAIHIEKRLNGQEVENAPGPYMQVGELVEWQYLVANTGIIPLIDVQVTAQQPSGEISVCTIARLEPGQNNVDIGVTCELQDVVEHGQYQSIAMASGIPELLVGERLIDTKSSHYFGYIAPAVGNYVWFDANLDGKQNADEMGIEGIDVTLVCAGSDGLIETQDDFIRTQKTASFGHYLFDEVPVDECYMAFGLSSDFSSLTFPNIGSEEAIDSDPLQETGRTSLFTVSATDHLIHWDAGLLGAEQVATIGTYVWNDQNYNGLQDISEPGMGGVMVELYDAEDRVINTTQTNSDGFYLLTTAPGDYYVKFVLPADHEFTIQNQGEDEQLDSDAHPETGMTNGLITLAPGENDLSWDAGLCARPLLEVYIADGSTEVRPGDTITYKLSYENLGLSDSTDVFITEIIPEHTTFDPTNSTPGWVCQNNGAGSQCVFSIGDVPAQSSTPPEFDLTFAVIVDMPILSEEVTVINNQVQIRDANECNEALSGTATATEQTQLTTPTGIDEADEPEESSFIFLPMVNAAK